MKRLSLLLFMLIGITACTTIKPVSITGPSGQQGFSMDCVTSTTDCFAKAGNLCPNGYDIVDHSTVSSMVVPHYGAYPMTVTRESLTIECK